jgi:G3E family GTPase
MTSDAIPFTVIGGFLGAGKTTLLNRLLRGATGRRFAVLVNDFGALDIDGGLVADHGGDTIALANGCLCCTIGDSLVTTLLSLLERPERFDHIVVEASGVADPGRIADLAVLEPRLARDGVIVVVDAAEVRARAADRRVGDTITRQLAAADLLVLNKTDLAHDLAVLRGWLSTHSAAPLLEARHADVPLDLLFGLDRYGGAAGGARRTGSRAGPTSGRSRSSAKRCWQCCGTQPACCVPRASCALPTPPPAARWSISWAGGSTSAMAALGAITLSRGW